MIDPGTDAVRIRRGTPADVADISRVAREGWHAAHDDIVGSETVEEMLREHHSHGTIHRRLTADPAITVVAVTDEVVGFAVVSPDDEDESRWHLGAIYVDDTHRRMGIGRALLAAAETRARARGAGTIRLVVMAENERARGFYEAMGYQLISMDHNPDLDVEDAVYERSL